MSEVIEDLEYDVGDTISVLFGERDDSLSARIAVRLPV